jgi:hypothetical protein
VTALGPHLPLAFPVPAGQPPSPKRRYRSTYRPPDPAALGDPAGWDRWSDFELAVRLIDCSPLEPLLAAHYRPSRKGQVPFHPVSMFLCLCLRREHRLGWRALARRLAGEHGAGWRALFGFTDGDTPSASGLRYFGRAVGAARLAALCPALLGLLSRQGLLPERSTYPGDPPTRGVTVAQDGMLHQARHRPSCALATDACYQPLAPTAATPATPATPGRACRAREKGREGCACPSSTCAERCVRASTRDPAARLIHYAGHNGHKQQRPAAGAPRSGAARPPAADRGKTVFGYRSIAERLLDDRWAVAWTLQSDLYPAATDERTVFVERFTTLRRTYPDLRLGEWLDDAGVGFSECLDVLWQAGIRRLVDLRADKSDADPAAWLRRGYDATGRPLCPHGYRLRANGSDARRHRAKYVCAQACRREPPVPADPATPVTPVTPVAGCPYLDPARSTGFVVNVGRTLPDGSSRLARDLPYGSRTWRARYGRRNLAESRNSLLESLGLKRLPVFGQDAAAREVHLADFLGNLRTLARLVRQASAPAP